MYQLIIVRNKIDKFLQGYISDYFGKKKLQYVYNLNVKRYNNLLFLNFPGYNSSKKL